MKKQILRFAVLVMVLTLGVSLASASPFVYNHEADGITYVITYTDNGDGTATVNFNVSGTYIGNHSGPDAILRALEVKVGSGSITDISGVPAGWTASANNLTGQGCTGGSSGNLCLTSTAGVDANSINLDFTVTIEQTGLFGSDNEIHLGALFQRSDEDSRVASQVSVGLTTTTTVPEPGSLGLLAIGLLGAGAVRRKLKKA